jgi:hypothetical protein
MLIEKTREIHVTQPDDFRTMCEALLLQLPADKRIASLAFYGDVRGNREYSGQLTILSEIISHQYPEAAPPLTYIAQKPLSGGLLLEACLFEDRPGQVITYGRVCGIGYLTIQNASCTELFTGGAMNMDPDTSTHGRAMDIFGRTGALMKMVGMPVGSIIRQWNYVENITGHSSGGQNYHEFNRARSDFYRSASWENGYPVATGIGVRAGGVVVRLEALACADSAVINLPLDNPLQVPAHHYSGDVLDGADHLSGTPKFERARLLADARQACILVSGTAAIRGERSMAPDDAVGQARITLENIHQLTAGETLKKAGYDIPGKSGIGSLLIYLKNESDYPDVKDFMDKNYPGTGHAYLLAGLCRDELLVEIEAIISLG